jgi:phosphoesterase RecJ-like protein
MRPDGDAVGSSLALSCALENLGIQTQVCVETELSPNLQALEGVEKLRRHPEEEFDLLVILDCADESRLGVLHDDYLRAKRKRIPTVNIDHHLTNPLFAQYNFVRPCASNCMHVAKLIEYMGAPFDKKTATYLMVGLITDSGQFTHDDVTGETFAMAQKLLEAGADISKLHYQLVKKQSRARAALFANVISKPRFAHDGQFCAIIITQSAMEETGASQAETEGFVDFPLSIDGVEVAAALMEVKRRQYRVSLRTKTYAKANDIAGVFGGGGHVRASGCMLFGELEEVLDKLSYAVYQHLET